MSRLSLKLASALALSICLAGLAAARQEPQQAPQGGRRCEFRRGDFHLVEGRTVRRVEFYGNSHTADSLIRRRLMLTEGDLFDLRRFRKGLERVNRLGIFEKVTEEHVEWCFVEGTTGEVDLNVEFAYKPSKLRRAR